MNDEARRLWQEKLELLLVEEAKAFDPAAKFKIQQDIAEARRKLTELTPTVQPATELDSSSVDVKWADELRIYGEGFVGRRDELAALDRAWRDGARIFALHAEGGAGKTRVVVEWLRRMRDSGWNGARRVFVHSFYSQGSDKRHNASSELFFEQALTFFGYRGEPITQADEKGRTLARLLLEHHGLLFLDGLEPLQHPTQHAEQGRLRDPGIARLLLSLANIPPNEPRGLCLITSRQPVIELHGRIGRTVIQHSLNDLNSNDGADLLRQFQVAGPDEELKRASDEFRGHAYSLMLLGSYLRSATDHHDIRRRREVVLLEEDTEHSSHARKMFAAYVRHLGKNSPEVAVLRLLGFFDRSVEGQLLDVMRAQERVVYEWSEDAEPVSRRAQPKRVEDSLPEVTTPLLALSQTQWFRVLNRLRELRLIDFTEPKDSPGLDTHPLLRECFAEQVRTLFPRAWLAGHHRLFEYLQGTTQYWPEGLEGLQPLYQAVAHGCLAGLHQQAFSVVYRDRILRGTGSEGFYSWKKLGASGADLGIVACFFTKPWATLVVDLLPADQAWLLNQAALYLVSLGRIKESAEPMRAGLKSYIQQMEWLCVARVAGNLSRLELARGELSSAEYAGKQAVSYAYRAEDPALTIVSITILADIMHQSGQRVEARNKFESADLMHSLLGGSVNCLYSLMGFQYCDFLLAKPECATWQSWLNRTTPLRVSISTHATCNLVKERAEKTLALSERYLSLLDVALDHLTLAKATLYLGQSARDPILKAMEHLRAAGVAEYICRGLLTRAWILYLSGDSAASLADLDEAWEIAERGSMPLLQADVQLTRARLFRDCIALEKANRLIQKHKYLRRKGELASALISAKKWPSGSRL